LYSFKKSCALLLATCLITTIGLTSVPAMGTERQTIAIINSQDAIPSRQTISSFESSIGQFDSYIDVILLGTDFSPLEQSHADLVFALGAKAVTHTSKIKTTAPILATMIQTPERLDPSKRNYALLLARSPKSQLEWHQRILPQAKRVGLLFDPNINQLWVDEAKRVAASLELEIIAVPVNSPMEIPAALKVLGRNADSILGIADATVYSNKTVRSVLLFSFRNRIPLVGLSKAWAKAGALYALDWNYAKLGQQAGTLAIRLLNENQTPPVSPTIVPLSQTPIYFLNLKTAKQMKLEFSEKITSAAAGVYK